MLVRPEFVFLRDWTLFLLLEATAVAAFYAIYGIVRKRKERTPSFFAHVEVFLRPGLVTTELPPITLIQRNYFQDSPAVERMVRELGGEVVTQLDFASAFIVKVPPYSIPKLAEHAMVERIEPLRVVSIAHRPRRSHG